jgi:hypothetical protein
LGYEESGEGSNSMSPMRSVRKSPEIDETISARLQDDYCDESWIMDPKKTKASPGQKQSLGTSFKEGSSYHVESIANLG